MYKKVYILCSFDTKETFLDMFPTDISILGSSTQAHTSSSGEWIIDIHQHMLVNKLSTTDYRQTTAHFRSSFFVFFLCVLLFLDTWRFSQTYCSYPFLKEILSFPIVVPCGIANKRTTRSLLERNILWHPRVISSPPNMGN